MKTQVSLENLIEINKNILIDPYELDVVILESSIDSNKTPHAITINSLCCA